MYATSASTSAAGSLAYRSGIGGLPFAPVLVAISLGVTIQALISAALSFPRAV